MKTSATPVFITGVGAVTCAGTNLKSFWNNAVQEKTGLNESGLGIISDSAQQSLIERFPQSAKLSKPALIAWAAIQDAMQEAGWSSLNADDGLIIATTVGQIPLWEEDLLKYLKKDHGNEPGNKIDDRQLSKSIRHQPLGSLAEVLSASLNFHGKSFVVSSACSAATQALGLATHWIRQGKVKRCLVGGTEVLSRLTLEGFRSLQLLSTDLAKPFDQNRQGINLSEGTGFFCLESNPERATAEISGVGFSTDAYHMAAPHPEGRGSCQAMNTAIQMAEISPTEVSWIHAHGTGSQANDRSEGAAIAQIFGSHTPWVSSTKWLHGHALAASGAIESALCVQAIRNNTILRTAGLKTPDPLIHVKHPMANIQTEIRHIVKNTLGFGGNNAALVLSSISSRGAR
jgi:3-oxoacyl-(acyl-carrier-protein) synthase